MASSFKNMSIVYKVSLGIVALLVLVAALFPGDFQIITQQIRQFIGEDFGWYYLLLMTSIVFFCLLLIVSPVGQIKLGDPGSKPEYSTISWVAMLFSAGMGIGLVFWGAAEPLSHFAVKAPESDPGSMRALQDAMKYTFFHWGIHAWAIYALVAVSLAYFKFRKKETSLLSVTLKPLFGSRMEGLLGYCVDSLTIVATVIGVATTLGFGAIQINGGLAYLLGIPQSIYIQAGIIIVTTCCFILSALSGIGTGVRILSNLNVILAAALLAVAIIVGPSVQIMNTFVDTIGYYLQSFFRLSFRTAAINPEHQEWIRMWTIFYWAWWISWSPFVGVFIARISRGRTIREFMSYVLLIPTLFSFIWFSAFGTLSTNAEIHGAHLAGLPTENILFATFGQYDGAILLSVVAVALVFFFFITSADSATFVLSMLSERGSLQPKNITKIIWGIIVSAIAMCLLFAGGLAALQNILIIVAMPFSLIVILMAISLWIELTHEQEEMGLKITPDRYPTKNNPFRSYED